MIAVKSLGNLNDDVTNVAEACQFHGSFDLTSLELGNRDFCNPGTALHLNCHEIDPRVTRRLQSVARLMR